MSRLPPCALSRKEPFSFRTAGRWADDRNRRASISPAYRPDGAACGVILLSPAIPTKAPRRPAGLTSRESRRPHDTVARVPAAVADTIRLSPTLRTTPGGEGV